MADVKWIKITTDIFDDDKILLIESLPEADSIIVIWFKLLCLAGKQNNSGVFIMGEKIAYTDKMLSTIFRRKESTVQLALKTFEQFGMIELIDGIITIPNWGKHQNLDQLESKKEYQRKYMKEYREKQKTLLCNTNSKSNCKTNSKANVSLVDKNREEKTREEETKIEEYNNNVDFHDSIHQIIDYLNLKIGARYRPNSKSTQNHIKARLKEGYSLQDFFTVIDKKCSEWRGTNMEQYLRPETLFGTKFEGYLNSKVNPAANQPQQGTGNIFLDMYINETGESYNG